MLNTSVLRGAFVIFLSYMTEEGKKIAEPASLWYKGKKKQMVGSIPWQRKNARAKKNHEKRKMAQMYIRQRERKTGQDDEDMEDEVYFDGTDPNIK